MFGNPSADMFPSRDGDEKKKKEEKKKRRFWSLLDTVWTWWNHE